MEQTTTERLQKYQQNPGFGVGSGTNWPQKYPYLGFGAQAGALDKYATDLTKMAREGKLDPVIGIEEEIERVTRILCMRKNSVCLTGEPGVGKTVIAEGLALKIINSAVPQQLQNKRILSIDVGSLVAGTTFRGQFEERLTSIVKEVQQSNGEIILFIDELHTVVGAGAVLQGPLDAANILKPSLARGELKCIGATTLKEYREHIEKDPALKRRFQVVQVPEPSVDKTVKILMGLKRKFEDYYGVSYSDDALITAAKLSKQYISDAFLPDKAIKIVEEAGAGSICNNTNDGQYKNVVIGCEMIKQVISSRTGIPVEKVTGDESVRLLDMENVFGKYMAGQDEAVRAVAQAVRRARVGFGDPDRPIATFLFTGPTGVGKTQLAKLLAREYYGSKESMVRLDMREYMEKHSVARLFESSPGYHGYHEGGQLTEPIRRNPHRLILLDEIEKAHVDVFNALLQVLDDGRLTDGKGQVTDFKSTIIIMTSNIGFKSNTSAEDHVAKEDDVSAELNRIFRPEFLNRLDEIIVFKRLGKVELMKIADIMLKEVCDRILQKKNLNVEIKTKFKDKLISESCNDVDNYGARPLKRAITRNLVNKLAESILNGNIKEGDSVSVNVSSKGDVLLSPGKKTIRKK
ncbi:OLC1v1007383C1 [Oldenlandia corymbosa var. corymbosa]|nr:OLC1v1007383C1 [Oldenlandia corymbosa var. corymbosa]